MIRFGLATAGLTGIYALALASADPWDLAIGAALAMLVLLRFHRYILPDPALPLGVVLSRVARSPMLAARTMAEIARGTIQMTRIVLGLTASRKAGFVVAEQGDRSNLGVIVNGMLETLSPGSILVDIEDSDATWTLHVLDATDQDTARAGLDRSYDRFQRPVWP